ncbi:glycosyltransferase family 4 protein [Nocardioides sp. GCM10030258]|uniref:glycosyltransferase family 4 protein n=1 Tax=unclassified Nocardioides TaxID=2615069 RepID=UPI0036108905
MRIAVVYDCLFPWTVGGGERLYRALAEEFAAQGHDVTYLTRRQWTGPTPVVEGVRIEAIAAEADLYDAVGARRLRPAIGFALALFWHLVRHRRRYDAVLVSALPATNVPAVRAALVGSRVVVCSDWLEVWPRTQWQDYSGPVVGTVAWMVQCVAARVSPLSTCHSALTARRLEESGARSAPLRSPGLIFETDRGVPRLIEPAAARVVFVGRHIEDKRVQALPGAIAYARRSFPDLTAQVYGDGPLRPAVLAEIERLGLAGVVTAPGFVSQAELDEAVRAASVLVNPSAREGYGLVVVEAAALGTPVVLVAGEDNAAVELVEHGVNGAVALSIAPEDLGDAIVEVVRAGAGLRRSAHAWFEQVAPTSSVGVTAARILDALEQRRAVR